MVNTIKDEEYVHEFPNSNYFKVHKRRALIIVCSDYENLR